MHKILLSVLLLVASFTAAFCQVTEVSNQELLELMEIGNLQLVDVRTVEEVSLGFIEGAQNIDFRNDNFENAISQLDRTKPIALYCGAGGRSGKASKLLLELGFQEIFDLAGGFSQWQQENYPVTKTE